VEAGEPPHIKSLRVEVVRRRLRGERNTDYPF